MKKMKKKTKRAREKARFGNSPGQFEIYRKEQLPKRKKRKKETGSRKRSF